MSVLVDPSQGLTLLHCASFWGNLKALKAYVEMFNADCNQADFRGQTPLHILVLSGNHNGMVYLCEKQIEKEFLNASVEALDSTQASKTTDLDPRDNALMTPIMNSVLACNDLAFVYLYFKGSCDLSQLDYNGNSMLHLAAKSNAINIAKLLRHIYCLSERIGVKRSGSDDHDSLVYFDVNRQNIEGLSPLILAI